MGKTLPPFSQLIEAERRRWAPFTRALSEADQAIVDRLSDGPKRHIQAGVTVSRPWAFETIVMAVLLAQHTQLERLSVCSRRSRAAGRHNGLGKEDG
jgi:hypothetical protein